MVSGIEKNGAVLNKKPHVLIMSIAFAGHFAPFVQIMYHLAARHRKEDIIVTVVGNKDRIADIVKLQHKGELQSLDIRLVEAFGPIPVYTADPKFPVRACWTSLANRDEFNPFMEKLIEEKDAPGAPTVILADMFQYWSKDLADKLGIPWYTYFSTSTAFTLCAMLYDVLEKEGLHPYKSTTPQKLVPGIPGLDFVRVGDLPEEILSFQEFYGNVSDRTKRATGILLNTAEELESGAGTIGALRAQVSSSTKVLPIGPSLQHPGFGFLYGSKESNSRCLEWMDSQLPSSVLYIAFGSLGAVSQTLINEIAVGLEASGVPFLWALKVGSAKLSDVLPGGFEERTKGRGLIETGWAPQSQILLHPSTGGFLSHCGWNSSLESMASGVPLITWPLSADQNMNARFIGDILKVGISISISKAKDQVVFDDITRNDVESAAKLLMLEGETRSEVKKNAVSVQKLLETAVREGGSSHRNLSAFLDAISAV